jgi:hypothetical protein
MAYRRGILSQARRPEACSTHTMLYRKTPARPTRLLLRIVTVASAGAALGLVACSGETTCGEGSCASAPQDGGDGGDGHVVTGVVPNPEGGDEHVVTGVVPNPEGGDDHAVSGAVDASPDVEDDHAVSGAVDGGGDGPLGVVVHPDAGAD